MDIPVDVDVYCSDGLCGRSTYVLLDSVHKEVTHLVVKESESPHTERVVPIEAVSDTAPDVIMLHCSRDELDKMDPFTWTEYIREKMPDLDYTPSGYVGIGSYWVGSYPVPDRTQIVAVEHKRVPLGERAIRRGTRVEATDGRVGHVDELLVDPENERMTHLVMREGHLWGQKDIVIPVSEVDGIREDTVYLKLSKDEIEALPAVPVHG
jgi:sporulation protein YlmC with PRC-barrel domain